MKEVILPTSCHGEPCKPIRIKESSHSLPAGFYKPIRVKERSQPIKSQCVVLQTNQNKGEFSQPYRMALQPNRSEGEVSKPTKSHHVVLQTNQNATKSHRVVLQTNQNEGDVAANQKSTCGSANQSE